MSDHNADNFIKSFNETVQAMRAFSEGDIRHEYLHALGKLFYGEEKTQIDRDILFHEDNDHSQTEIFTNLVHLQITLDDMSQLLQGLTRLFPHQASSIHHANNIIGKVMDNNEKVLINAKEQHDNFLIDNDLPCGRSAVEYAWDMLCDYVPRSYVLNTKEPHQNIHEVRRQTVKLTEAFQKIADIHTARAQRQLGYFHQCLSNETQPDLPTGNIEWQSLDREQQHKIMQQITKNDLASAIATIRNSEAVVKSVVEMTHHCFPKNKHQLGIRIIP